MIKSLISQDLGSLSPFSLLCLVCFLPLCLLSDFPYLSVFCHGCGQEPPRLLIYTPELNLRIISHTWFAVFNPRLHTPSSSCCLFMLVVFALWLILVSRLVLLIVFPVFRFTSFTCPVHWLCPGFLWFSFVWFSAWILLTLDHCLNWSRLDSLKPPPIFILVLSANHWVGSWVKIQTQRLKHLKSIAPHPENEMKWNEFVKMSMFPTSMKHNGK